MADRFPNLRSRLARAGRILADTCHVTLSVTLWLAGTVLAALGAVFAFVIVAADGRPLRFFAHLQNLSTHYLFADPAARKHFDGQVLVLFLGVVGLFLIARLPGFATRLRRELGQNHMGMGGRHG
jgi:hypothetical protein